MQYRRRHTGQRSEHTVDELRREIDLGHEQQNLLARIEHRRDEIKIDLGFSAAGDTMQQRHGKHITRFMQRFCGSLLRRRERR